MFARCLRRIWKCNPLFCICIYHETDSIRISSCSRIVKIYGYCVRYAFIHKCCSKFSLHIFLCLSFVCQHFTFHIASISENSSKHFLVFNIKFYVHTRIYTRFPVIVSSCFYSKHRNKIVSSYR